VDLEHRLDIRGKGDGIFRWLSMVMFSAS